MEGYSFNLLHGDIYVEKIRMVINWDPDLRTVFHDLSIIMTKNGKKLAIVIPDFMHFKWIHGN